jgi:hypothetical protein
MLCDDNDGGGSCDGGKRSGADDIANRAGDGTAVVVVLGRVEGGVTVMGGNGNSVGYMQTSASLSCFQKPLFILAERCSVAYLPFSLYTNRLSVAHCWCLPDLACQ